MYRQKLCLGLNDSYGIEQTEQVKLLKKIGFDGFFICDCDRKAPVEALVRTAKEENMMIQSMHAPFNRCDDMWDETGEKAQIAVDEMLMYVEKCAKYEIPLMVTHTYIGFDYDHPVTQAGIERYGRIAKRASELGIKFALENTEGEQYLAALMENLRSEKSVGFCWDSGHEMCYNLGKDMLELYGDRLWGTHLNDNLGCRDYDGKITYIDDLHLVPFDGIADWHYNMARLKKCGFEGPLTFELTTQSKPGRCENDCYRKMTAEEYFTLVFMRACKVAKA